MWNQYIANHKNFQKLSCFIMTKTSSRRFLQYAGVALIGFTQVYAPLFALNCLAINWSCYVHPNSITVWSIHLLNFLHYCMCKENIATKWSKNNLLLIQWSLTEIFACIKKNFSKWFLHFKKRFDQWVSEWRGILLCVV